MGNSILSKGQLGYGTVQRGVKQGQGYFHFPETGEPSEVTPVSINQERTRQGVRESNKMANRNRVKQYGYGVGHQGEIRTKASKGDSSYVESAQNIIPRTPKSQWRHLTNRTIDPMGPIGIAASRRLGKVEWVPTTQITAVQPTVSKERVDELRNNPERGSSYRLPPGEETPWGVRNRGKTILVQGNHRVNADMANGRLFTPVRVIHDVSHPDTQNKLWDVYDSVKNAQHNANEKKRSKSFMKDFGGPRSIPGYSPNDRIEHIRKMYGK